MSRAWKDGLPRDAQDCLSAHESLLARWRKAMDLVGPEPLAPHFEDAVGSVQGLEATGRWADLGSGAGFPGVALSALHPDAHVVLVESRRKRAVFLEKVVYEAGLPPTRATVLHGRTEALEDGEYDGVISRAYKQPAAYLADAWRLLKSGGRAVLLTGDQDTEELAGFEQISVSRYRVGDGWRRQVVLRKP